MADIFTCAKCKKEFSSDNPDCKAIYHDDNEDEWGYHTWDVLLCCPYCGHWFWETIWDGEE